MSANASIGAIALRFFCFFAKKIILEKDMKHKQAILLILLFTFSFFATIKAQTNNNRVRAISASIFNENITIPFNKRNDAPKHLGGTLSYEISKKRNGVYQFTHIFQVGYYYHKYFNQVAFIGWKPKFEFRWLKTFNVHATTGIGYAHSFPTYQTYQLDNGTYKKKKNSGKSHFMPSIGVGIGVDLKELGLLPFTIYSRYEVFSLAPYAPKGTIPLTINTMMSFGLTYKLN